MPAKKNHYRNCGRKKKLPTGKKISCGISMSPEEQARVRLSARLAKTSVSGWIMAAVRARWDAESVKYIEKNDDELDVPAEKPDKKTGKKTMKKIINGKKYDTETAERLGEWNNGCGAGDFNQCDETLYRKTTGEFFLYGEGGARSKYAETYEGGRTVGGGEAIVPLTEEEARKWAEEKLSGEEYEEIFGEIAE